MKHKKLLLALFATTLFYAHAQAQKENKDKIVGCWKLVKMEFEDPNDPGKEDADAAINSVVCLKKDGKFETNAQQRKVQGVYAISADGKTMTQSMEGMDGGEDGEILLLTDTNLDISAAGAILHMVRIKE
ncbi:MAG: hypothetical protein CFE23_02465 [Flavobacterium sp. BFFFF1]|uniref:hypothetical protein n=1 Tax=unclassified Flavobacterium TaxID=196869 RepID=UPI000BD6BB1B|nr:MULTISPECIES: hypothetical protein [unclassified Flavobacterium]OYU81767.1 MAG: hypothetical protein CFE23_02465 [Flavobacterium sp. BFFFF1]